MDKLDHLDLCELALGRPIVINFNDKFRFLADARLVHAKSATIAQFLKPDIEIYNVTLPHYENIPNIVEYFKTGKFTSFEPEMFPTLFANAYYLQLKDITVIMADLFVKDPAFYVQMPDFKACITKQMFCELMFAQQGKSKLHIQANTLSKNLKVFGTYFGYAHFDTFSRAIFPQLWQICKEFELLRLRRGLEEYFVDNVDDPDFMNQIDMNSKFISHQDFQRLMLLNPERLQLRRGGINLKKIIFADKHYFFALKIWLRKHPEPIGDWFETMRYVTGLI